MKRINRILSLVLVFVLLVPASAMTRLELRLPRSLAAVGIVDTPKHPDGTPAGDPYLYTGEQFDPDLGFYYLRARYSNPDSGRFWTMDSYEGDQEDPLSLHKHLYGNGSPVDRKDPSGHMSVTEENSVANIAGNMMSQTFKVLNIIQKVRSTLDLIQALESIYAIAQDPTFFSQYQNVFKSGLSKEFDAALSPGSIEKAIDTLRNNSSRIVKGVVQHHGLEILKDLKNPNSAFVIYMPTPPSGPGIPNPAGLISTGLHIEGKPLKLFFGKGGYRGRLIGVGTLPNRASQDPNHQFFRMDYHGWHPGTHPADHEAWPDGDFHFHIPRW